MSRYFIHLLFILKFNHMCCLLSQQMSFCQQHLLLKSDNEDNILSDLANDVYVLTPSGTIYGIIVGIAWFNGLSFSVLCSFSFDLHYYLHESFQHSCLQYFIDH